MRVTRPNVKLFEHIPHNVCVCSYHESSSHACGSQVTRENEQSSGSKTSGLEEDEIFDEDVESFAVGDWVLVSYDSEQFPGEITNITNPKTDIEVNAMHHCGTSNTYAKIFGQNLAKEHCWYH